MNLRYFIVDDDASVRRIIQHIIVDYHLGVVIGQSGDGLEAETQIRALEPDVVLVDLLLPTQDGVELIQKLGASNTSFIMISESQSQQMITKAYESGVEFYIHKPINVLEITSVIKRVQESRKLKTLVSLISNTTAQYTSKSDRQPEVDKEERKAKVYKVFSDLGIIGEAGAKDIYFLMRIIYGVLRKDQDTYQLNEIYEQLAREKGQDAKTVEQRIRRTVTKALNNLAGIGVVDYYNSKFQLYSTAVFDFMDVRQEMNYIQGKSPYHGKVNIKKFIEGLLYTIEES